MKDSRNKTLIYNSTNISCQFCSTCAVTISWNEKSTKYALDGYGFTLGHSDCYG